MSLRTVSVLVDSLKYLPFLKMIYSVSDPFIPSLCTPASRDFVLVGSRIPPLLSTALAFHSWHHGWYKGCPVAGCHPGPLGPPEVSHKSESCQPSRAVGR